MAEAKSGNRISLRERRPPFIVVDHSVESVIVARWPGKLWRVRIVDPVTDADVRATGISKLSSAARYTRAVSVDVLEEVPVSKLFGPHGDAVVRIIERACRLRFEDVKLLAQSRQADADAAYSRAWKKWANDRGIKSDNDNYAGVLEIHDNQHGTSSPVNHGLAVLFHAVEKCAESLDRSSYFVMGKEGEAVLEATWSLAAFALLDAAIAVGAPELSTQNDCELLTSSWRTLIDSDNSGG